MNMSSLGSALSSAMDAPVPVDPVGQIQAQAQVSILKKAMQVQAETVSTLIASVTSGSVGRNLNVHG